LPRQERTEPRSTLSFVLSIAMHVAFVVVLFFAISWKTRSPAPVVAELWTPPPPAAAPRPVPKPEPQPAPPPKPAPPPEPKVEAKPPEKVDIALEQEKERKRLEEERKRLEALELKRREEERRREEARKREEAEKTRKEEEARRLAEEEKKRKEEEARARVEREKKEREERIAAEKRFKDELERETRERMARELAKASPQASREGVAAVPGDPNATAGYVDKIRAKIRGNVILPPAYSGNPEAEFIVQQLPTGEILSVKLTRSSGSKALDDAWERAILKSSPLPLPEKREIFQATLRLKFSPSDK